MTGNAELDMMFRSSIYSPQSDYVHFELSELLESCNGEWAEEDPTTTIFGNLMNPIYVANEVGSSSMLGTTSYHLEGPGDGRIGSARETKDNIQKISLRVLSKVDILDDGFKWRKYGKKMVKNSPYPRSYYRCSVEACPVKKRVEKDRDDSRYVITSYENVHLHGPSTK